MGETQSTSKMKSQKSLLSYHPQIRRPLKSYHVYSNCQCQTLSQLMVTSNYSHCSPARFQCSQLYKHPSPWFTLIITNPSPYSIISVLLINIIILHKVYHISMLSTVYNDSELLETMVCCRPFILNGPISASVWLNKVQFDRSKFTEHFKMGSH